MGGNILQFLAGMGFKHFVDSVKKLRGDDKKGDGKNSQAGGLLQNLSAARALPQNAMTPGGGASVPPMLQSPQGSPGFLAMLAKLMAATQGRGQ